VAARGGERFLTPETQFPIADFAMWNTFGLGLDHMLAATGGIGYASGGIVPVPGSPGERMNKRVVPTWLNLQKRFNLFLTDAFGPGHASPEHTRYGTAIDVVPGPGGSWGDVNRAVAYSVNAGYTPVYYDGSGGSIDLPPHGPGHHAHMTLLTASELLGGASPGGGAAPQLIRPRLRGPKGPLRSLGQAAIDKPYGAAKRYLAEKLAAMGSHGSLSSYSADGNVERVFAQVAKRLATSRTAAMALGMAGYAESGMRDLSYGHSTSQGALQLLASTASGMGINPHDEGQIAAAFLQRGFYGRGGANKLAGQGLPAHLVAQGVQGSAFSSGSNYLAQADAAKRWMSRFGLATGGRARGGPSIAALTRMRAGAAPVVNVTVIAKGSVEIEDVIAEIDGQRADIADFTLREGGRGRSRARQLAGRHAS
jgi:hypothetical protein